MSTRASTLMRPSESTPTKKTRATSEARSEKSHYRPLPKEFRHDGFQYRQIAGEGDAAIYEQTWNGCAEPSLCCEGIRIRRRHGFRVGGRFVEWAEVYPRSEPRGVDSFTSIDKDRAFAKLKEMEAK
jgi:hypothetical protein